MSLEDHLENILIIQNPNKDDVLQKIDYDRSNGDITLHILGNGQCSADEAVGKLKGIFGLGNVFEHDLEKEALIDIGQWDGCEIMGLLFDRDKEVPLSSAVSQLHAHGMITSPFLVIIRDAIRTFESRGHGGRFSSLN